MKLNIHTYYSENPIIQSIVSHYLNLLDSLRFFSYFFRIHNFIFYLFYFLRFEKSSNFKIDTS